MKLQESGEMYLETIYILAGMQEKVRSIDISRYMGYSKPSVSRAVNNLRDEKYLKVNTDSTIELTASGHEIAERIYERHQVLAQCLEYIGVDRNLANEDACRIEHVISTESFNALKEHLKNQKQNNTK